MELLIEAIIWLVKSLFGDPEKTVDTSRQTRKPAVRPRRGPYNYGDDSSNAPKTLEEILQEARRQANQRKEGTAPVQPTPKIQRRVLETAEAPQRPARENVAPSIPVREIISRDVEAPKPIEAIEWAMNKKAEPAPQKPATIVTKSPEATPEPKQQKRVRKAAAQATASTVAISDILQAIRVAPPAEKRAAARQAIILYEVFGPPRSLRRHSPGSFLRRGRQ
jgi:hypothetical protein